MPAQPTPNNWQLWTGHAIVAAVSSAAVHKVVKGPLWFSVLVGSIVGVAAHDYFDAPVSKGVAAITA